MPEQSQVVVLVTCPDRNVAEDIASKLIEENIAACVNVLGGVTSLYRWEGRIERDTEVLLIIKTRLELLAAVETRVASLHPYDVPEVIGLPIAGGSEKYLHWIDSSTSAGGR